MTVVWFVTLGQLPQPVEWIEYRTALKFGDTDIHWNVKKLDEALTMRRSSGGGSGSRV